MVRAAGFVLGMASSVLVAAGQTRDAGDSPTIVALRFFEALPPGKIHHALRTLRPPRITADQRAAAVATLPRFGELPANDSERRKLTTLKLLQMEYDPHQVFEVKVIDLPHAALSIYQHAVLLVTRPALRLLSAAELQAAVAHELGHEYFWSDYEDPRLAHSVTGRQTLELKCDGVAALTLLELGLDSSAVVSAMRKVTTFNDSLGATVETKFYPTVRERERFLLMLMKGAGPGSAGAVHKW